jgi:prepilin-type N-terminal cleavage/methylation domain-containing protein
MRSLKAFTLIEMLAVIGIMLVLMVAAFGTFSLFSERIGPESAMATLQGILNGARSYAAANGVYARVEFSINQAASGGSLVRDGTLVTVMYRNAGDANAKAIRGAVPVTLGNQIYVVKGIPTLSGQTKAAAPLSTGPTFVDAWRNYQNLVLKDVNAYAIPFLQKTAPPWPYIEFDPTGYLVDDDPSTAMKGLTIVQRAGAQGTNQVTQYLFYPMNVFTGTRLVFE